MDIKVSNLTKTYGPQKAVDGISFEVKTGEILGFLGPNGAGKSTTMKILSCYMSPTEGGATIGNYDIHKDAQEIKRRIGYLPENNPLYLDMPVMEYLEFAAKLQGVTKDQLPGQLQKIVRICGLNKEKHKKIGELSKGYRQRVGLGQALIHDPEILILDEPTTGLDPNQIVEIRNLIRDIGSEKTVILSTHILPEVEATCDRILIINEGKIVADGTPDTLRNQAQGKATINIQVMAPPNANVFDTLLAMNDISLVDPLAGGEGRYQLVCQPNGSTQNLAHHSLATREAIFDLCVREGWKLTELSSIETRLEDIFRDLTVK